MELDLRVSGDEVVEIRPARDLAGDDARIVPALVDEVDQAVGEHAGVEVDVPDLVQPQQNRVGNGADAELDPGAARD